MKFKVIAEGSAKEFGISEKQTEKSLAEFKHNSEKSIRKIKNLRPQDEVEIIVTGIKMVQNKPDF